MGDAALGGRRRECWSSSQAQPRARAGSTGTRCGVLLATAEIVRHLIPVPALLLGLLIARWPHGLAGFYAKVFGDLGLQGYSEAYSSRTGVWFVRGVGVFFAVVAAFWIVVGTG